MRSQPQVFIVESLRYDDETHKRYEGDMISQILRLNLKDPRYFYIRTQRELSSMMGKFSDSQYRYLHLSCHANSTCMATTLDRIAFPELAKLLKPHLAYRRLFVSACEMVNDDLAQELLPGSNCYSIMGPSEKVAFSDAAILWSAFYHLMNERSSSVMKGPEIRKVCADIAKLFGVDLRYYWYESKTKKIRHHDMKK